jgi:hypothetical protein
MMKKQSLAAFLLILTLSLVCGMKAFAEKPAIDYHMDSHQIPSKNGTPETSITVETADPDQLDNPNGGTSQNGTGSGGKTNSPSTGTPTTNPPGGTQSTGTNSPGTGSPGANTPSDPNTGRTSPGQADPSSANPGDTQSKDAHPGQAKPGEAQPAKPNTPWYESLWNKTKQAVKGGIAGAIGAGIVIGLVVVGAAILGVTVGVPLLITAAVVGVVAGAIYGIMAGDNFSWIKGIGIGGIAALTVISIGELGVGAAFRGALQAIRSAGLRGALRMAGGRSLGLLRGALGGLKSFGRGLLSSPLQTLKSAVFNKFFGTTFGINLGGNYLGHMAATGKIPGTGETLQILGESFVSTLIFDRIFRFKFPTGKSGLGTGDVGNFKNVKNLADFRSRIPKNATKLPWQKIPGGAEKGIKYRWTDPNGDVYNVRAHGPDPSAPAGSNAADGWIYRVEVRFGGQGKTFYMDSSGNFHPQNVMKPSSPMYNESIANDTHIPFTK